MSCLVAYFGNEPENMACALFSARNALYSNSSDRPQGWGLGFVQAGDVLLQKRPRADTKEVDLYVLAKDLRADALVGCVGLSRDGNISAEDADPFRFRSWLFGSVGGVSSAAFASVRERVLESVPDFLRRNIRGKSPSEHIFHLFLSFLHDAGILDAPSPATDAVQRALRHSLAFLDRLLSGGSDGQAAAAPSSLALVATNGRCLVATSSAFPMQYLDVEGISDCPVCHGRPDANRDGRRIPHDALRAVIIEANPATAGRAGWKPIADRSALIVGADRVPRVVSLNSD
jgi:predicted glutamine amidotransferase